MSARAHIRRSDVPLAEGSDITADCGQIIPKAHFLMQYEDGQQIHTSASTFLLCKKCSLAAAVHERYLYAIIEGQAAMTEVA